jgi:U3 small nucleolar ribonucleoprotein protein IMP3
MVRKLKHHESKLLRKVDFTTYKSSDPHHRASAVLRRYHIQAPADYTKYNRLAGSLRQLAHKLTLLDPTDPIRRKHEELLLGKLYDMGVLSQRSKLSEVERKVGVSAFARRRLGVVMTRLRMCESVSAVSLQS